MQYPTRRNCVAILGALPRWRCIRAMAPCPTEREKPPIVSRHRRALGAQRSETRSPINGEDVSDGQVVVLAKIKNRRRYFRGDLYIFRKSPFRVTVYFVTFQYCGFCAKAAESTRRHYRGAMYSDRFLLQRAIFYSRMSLVGALRIEAPMAKSMRAPLLESSGRSHVVIHRADTPKIVSPTYEWVGF